MGDKQIPWGTRVERGVVTHAWQTPTGVYMYDVESVDRPGITLKKLPALCDAQVNDIVFFSAFEDGEGLVLRKTRMDESDFGSMAFSINENGRLIYTRSDNVLTDFEIENGHLIRSADTETDLVIGRDGHLYLV